MPRGLMFDLMAETSELERRLLRQRSRTSDLRPALRVVADLLRSGYDQQYASGRGWAPLSPATIRRKGNRRKLVSSGELHASFTERGHRYHREVIERNAVTVASTNPVANVLRTGARGMPKRDPAKVNVTQLRRGTSELLAEFITTGRRPRRLGL